MRFIADFHLHSHFSVATSKNLVPEHTDYWARVKGIKVVGTGDFTHPGWMKELEEKLEPAEPGLFRLRREYRLDRSLKDGGLKAPFSSEAEARFMLTSEISNIYKRDGKVRKVHNLILVPDFETAKNIQGQLAKRGNIHSDGRPILGLDSRDLLEIVLNSSPEVLLVPAHIWTPWFSALGDKSGFDTIEECYADLAEHIHCIETGLSSDPPMNWLCSFLDSYTIISNSDAHSPEKMGREANLFDTELCYKAIVEAITRGNPGQFLGTVEFFPQEGKYHYDGHRKCGICWAPLETLKNQEICPVCGKRVTIGVMNRVAQLADREEITERTNRHPFYSLIPLRELLAEMSGTGPQSKQVAKAYNALIEKASSEFHLLLGLSIDEIKDLSNEILAEGIRRMRAGEVLIREGFDGEYGRIKVFHEHERRGLSAQKALFDDLTHNNESKRPVRRFIDFDVREYMRLREHMRPRELRTPQQKIEKETGPLGHSISASLAGLNQEQRQAAEHSMGPALMLAGPGTGKTHTLTQRIVNLILNRGAEPESILTLTFTNKAAGELKDRLKATLEAHGGIERVQVSTFHALGLSILKSFAEKTGRTAHFSLIDEDDKKQILCERLGCESRSVKEVSNAITFVKQGLKTLDGLQKDSLAEVFRKYESILRELSLFDLDDLLYRSLRLFDQYPEILDRYRERYRWLQVDEYQDINSAQYQMVRRLMPRSDSDLCVIGDPNQAIYGFRGADVRFIQRFIHDYPEAKVYRLKKSYRCSRFILEASRSVMKGTDSDFSPLEGLAKGVKVKIFETGSDKSEAEFVARSIEAMMGGLRFFSLDSQITDGDETAEIESLSDFVVLCRIKEQMKVVEDAFNDHSIPYQTVGTGSFFRQEPIRSIIDILKLSFNPQNSFLYNRLIEKKKIGLPTVKEFNALIGGGTSVKKVVSKVIDICCRGEGSEYEETLSRLMGITEGFGRSFEEFIQYADLGAGVDSYMPETESVTLMSLHASKGLEFKCVFIVGCENRLIPLSLFASNTADLDEERRLFYVGMTRAQRFLFLTHARKRYLHGREYCLERSPFVDSIEEELVELSKPKYVKREKKQDFQLDLF